MKMSTRIGAVLSVLLLLAGLIAEAEARPRKPAWTPLGERVVSDRLERDSIRVSAADGAFSKLQLQVRRRAVEFRDMKVHFANGEVFDVPLRRVVPAGGRSQVIDLPGKRRVIERVTFSYDAQAFAGGTATVRLFGRR